jgi:hypothetical protein
MGARLGVGVLSVGVIVFGETRPGAGFGAALGVGALGVGTLDVSAGACVDFGAGVQGSATGSGFGFGFILVIKKDNFAPVPLGNHSMKLYEGK